MNEYSNSIISFDYHLPDEKIAYFPVEPRDSSKLLIYKKQTITESFYSELYHHLPEDSLLVFNNTKVIEARLIFEKSNVVKIELFCLAPAYETMDISAVMLQKNKVLWKCMIGGAKKWKDEILTLNFESNKSNHILSAKKITLNNIENIIEFVWDDKDLTFAEVLHAVGKIPLPPYIKRNVTIADHENYQTIYALKDGSVAAPTAGLHFTESMFDNLKKNKINTSYLTLHVGAGTFMPIKTDSIDDHIMHEEFIEISKDLILLLLQQTNQNTIAVGTTSLRSLESLYWIGVKIIETPKIRMNELVIQQWDAYQLPQNISKKQALESVLNWMNKNDRNTLLSKTQLMIKTDYKIRMVDAIITNFHQPQSTLLLLISAFVGNDWRKIYDYALNHEFRFLSYGDGCLLWNSSKS